METTALSTFQHEKFGEIRTLIKEDGEPWFVAKEVAVALGYKNSREAIIEHCKGGSEMLLPSKGGNQLTKIIPESDLYR
ncbi:MAG TPA: phage antirepressor Ant, partial [Deferribacteraceae bacterium]|nr:phage antirepressor Ant [Deferribacteraceae bacterium]